MSKKVNDVLVDVSANTIGKATRDAIFAVDCPSCGRLKGFLCAPVWDPYFQSSELLLVGGNEAHLARVKAARQALLPEDLKEPFVRITL